MHVPGFNYNPIMLAIEGAVIGFIIAVPVGPAAALCIRRSITIGAVAGYLTGLGAALGDAVFGAVAAFGLSFVEQFVAEHEAWLCATGRAPSAIRCPTTASTGWPRTSTSRPRASSSPCSIRSPSWRSARRSPG